MDELRSLVERRNWLIAKMQNADNVGDRYSAYLDYLKVKDKIRKLRGY